MHPHSRTPIKKTKKKPLSKEQKQFNKRLAKERIVVEHVHILEFRLGSKKRLSKAELKINRLQI
ncbi:transposase family protein [Microcoleus sp. K4-B3]|uniref:transposase family protein n=1 Tax=Microcoleus sp. K4-B3 TaxID=2818791 RepID=UPI004040C0BB